MALEKKVWFVHACHSGCSLQPPQGASVACILHAAAFKGGIESDLNNKLVTFVCCLQLSSLVTRPTYPIMDAGRYR